MHTISIIVPVYNVIERLEICINSICNQTYKKLEIIVVDDGSSDGSSDLCDTFLNVDKRIKVFHKENGGLSDARNFGMSKATGEYLVFIDSDDVIHPKFCELLIEAVLKFDAEIASVNILEYYEDSEIEKRISSTNDKVEYSELVNSDIVAEYLFPVKGKKITHGVCNKLYKRSLFDELMFEKGRLHEDLYITYRLLDKSRKYIYTNAEYYFYYQSNANSICKNYGERNFNDEFDAITCISKYFAGRVELKDQLTAFTALQYKSMVEKLIDHNSKQVANRILYIRTWILKNTWKSALLSTYSKAKIYFAVFFTTQFRKLKQIKGKKVKK